MKKTSGKVIKIKVSDFSFSPNYIVVKPNTEIVWKNMDAVTHVIQSIPLGYMFMSSVLKSGESFSFHVPVNSYGVYHYSCAIYPSMKAKIMVTK